MHAYYYRNKRKWSGPLQYEDKSKTLMMLPTDMVRLCVCLGGWVCTRLCVMVYTCVCVYTFVCVCVVMHIDKIA